MIRTAAEKILTIPVGSKFRPATPANRFEFWVLLNRYFRINARRKTRFED
jgi:hypothetical protein